ncbi:unnamed protein product [Pleuronectes platessa]|uniref:Uncharacterized protein n=1 Tax=Pleuronectes platessa TaxID=8262 RepID=A0A9N7VY24_PLEPL|nr:unnamed protein product [Pleuronectes platessa]
MPPVFTSWQGAYSKQPRAERRWFDNGPKTLQGADIRRFVLMLWGQVSVCFGSNTKRYMQTGNANMVLQYVVSPCVLERRPTVSRLSAPLAALPPCRREETLTPAMMTLLQKRL